MTLNEKVVRTVVGKDKPFEIRDSGPRGIPGLLLRVQPTGSKTYYLQHGRGKRLRIGSSSLTLSQARELARKAMATVEQGNDPAKRRAITLSRFIEEEYTPYFATHHRTTNSLDNLRALKEFYEKDLRQINETAIKRWRTRRVNAGRKPATVNRNVSALNTLLNFAVDEGWLSKNPISGLSKLKETETNRVRFLSSEEESRLREALDRRESRIVDERRSANQWRAKRNLPALPDLSNFHFADYLKPMVLLSLNTGLRRGELFRVEWKDIVEGVVAVRESKSGRGRHVPLNSEARSILEGWRPNGGQCWLFENDGKPFGSIKTAWAGILREADIEDFRWHDLRHHFASKLVMASVPLNSVRELLGHSDLKMTLRYAHLAPEHLKEAVERI